LSQRIMAFFSSGESPNLLSLPFDLAHMVGCGCHTQPFYPPPSLPQQPPTLVRHVFSFDSSVNNGLTSIYGETPKPVHCVIGYFA